MLPFKQRQPAPRGLVRGQEEGCNLSYRTAFEANMLPFKLWQLAPRGLFGKRPKRRLYR